MDQAPNSRKRQIIATLAVLIVIAVIVATATLAGGREDETSNVGGYASSSSTNTASSSANYTDGTYSAEGGYNSPGGAETITIEVTIKDGVVTNTSAEPGATNTEAEEHQADFIAAYDELVLGKNIGSLELNRVAGSSLTTIGFNNALTQIRSEAEV